MEEKTNSPQCFISYTIKTARNLSFSDVFVMCKIRLLKRNISKGKIVSKRNFSES